MCLDMLLLLAFMFIVLYLWMVGLVNLKLNANHSGVVIATVLTVILIIFAVIIVGIHWSGNCIPWKTVD